MRKRVIIWILAFSLIAILFSIQLVFSAFEIQNLLLKVSVQQGDVINRSIAFSSVSGDNLFLESDSPWIYLHEKEVLLGPGEGKRANMVINTSKLSPGVYIGNITVRGDRESSSLPVILEIESKDLFFDSNVDIPPQYTDVLPGGKIIAQIKVFDLTTSGGTSKGLGSAPVDLVYEVRAMNGALLVSESENIVVSGQVLVTKSLSIPQNIRKGDYIFSVGVSYKSSFGTSSKFFRVIDKSEENNFSKGGASLQPYYMLLFALLFLALLLFFFAYFMRDRDKMLLELRKYNTWELRQQKKLLIEQANILSSKGMSKNQINKEVSNKIRHLKEKQEKRVYQVKSLRKRGNLDEMKRKIEEWKKRGYNTLSLEYKMKGLSDKEMMSLLSKWKKQGYTEGYKNQ